MDSMCEAIKKFEDLDFRVKHIKGIPPFKDEEKIKKIRSDLENCGTDGKTRAFLEWELNEQLIGTPEIVEGFKSYTSFDGLYWNHNNNVRSYLDGNFNPKTSTYNLMFCATPPDRMDKPNQAIMLGLYISYDKKNPNDMLDFVNKAIAKERKLWEIDESIIILNTPNIRLVSPTFYLNISCNDLNESHAKLIDTMGKMGYKNGVLWNSPSKK